MNVKHADYQVVLDVAQIAEILPHRYPFLLVDKVIKLDIENKEIIGLKALTINEQFFQGHFPKKPIMPGVLIIEALAQTGGILIHQTGYRDQTALLLSINHAKFRRPVFPGDMLYLHATGIHFGSLGGKVEAKALVDGKIVAQAEIGFALQTF